MLTFVTVNGEGTPHVHDYEDNYFNHKNIVVLCDYCPLCDAICEEMDYSGENDPILIGAYLLNDTKGPLNIELLREDQKAPAEIVNKIRSWFFSDRDDDTYSASESDKEDYEDDFEYDGEGPSYEDDEEDAYHDEGTYDEEW